MKAIRAYAVNWNDEIAFLIKDGDVFATQIIMTKREDPATQIAPSFVLTKHESQILIDDLWNAGLRPTEGTGSAGALAATQKHLEDMRTLVFQK